MLEIIPAIDLRGGCCVRLYQGDFSKETVYDEDPLAAARRWVELGATRLHVVDLDGARAGEPRQLDLAASIARIVPVPVQLGGGLRDLSAVQRALESGIERAILGTAAIESKSFRLAALDRFGDRLIIGLDVRRGSLAARGWVHATELEPVEFARRIASEGASRVVYTDIERDGTLDGPNIPALIRLAEIDGLRVIASGGVGKLQDLFALAETNVEAAIVGQALYAGALSLPSALAALSSSPVPQGGPC